MEEFVYSDVKFDDVQLSILVESLRNCFKRKQDAFVYICKDVYSICNSVQGMKKCHIKTY